ncbi:unnamed protein product [Parnassius apollo]|uniref:(apollo) hypothetical protein n=1 Tax=Parnassius apollo TaxID=110799 RepID=A0A8S3X5W0_PARAO|nr:unnamed protein product [Parnassius apollo]
MCRWVVEVVNEDPPEAMEYVRIAKDRLSLENECEFSVDDSNNPHLGGFPQLTITDLKRLALGTYQLKQARSYYGE